jgi:hypothetical protein
MKTKTPLHLVETDQLPAGVRLEDFVAYMPSGEFIFMPTGQLWPAKSVNAQLPKIRVGTASGKSGEVKASDWLEAHAPVVQMTWAPGEPRLINDLLIAGGGWIARSCVTVFNLYRPPTLAAGDAGAAGLWLQHVRRIYPDDADHIVLWLAHRVQRPEEKINHALVLGGTQGIGKDSLIEPVKRAVGHWNVEEIAPHHLLGNFTGHYKSVILRVSEAADLGDTNRFALYDRMKTLTAAPPDVLRVNEKHIREYYVPNCCGVVITTNHKTDGLFLPADDRRHYVTWSDANKDDFTADYWNALWTFYDSGGDRNVAA